MRFKVSLTQSALNDLYAINDYYLKRLSVDIASGILAEIQNAIQSLDNFPERGSVPSELTIAGIIRYRQVISSVYRIMYRIEGDHVYIVMLIDGRRDVSTALLRRLQV